LYFPATSTDMHLIRARKITAFSDQQHVLSILWSSQPEQVHLISFSPLLHLISFFLFFSLSPENHGPQQLL